MINLCTLSANQQQKVHQRYFDGSSLGMLMAIWRAIPPTYYKVIPLFPLMEAILLPINSTGEMLILSHSSLLDMNHSGCALFILV